MIYEPQPYFNVSNALGAGFVNALARYAADYIIGDVQDWAYYVGYGVGGSALATGIPYANTVVYVIGSGATTLFLEGSPSAATVRILLDGVEDATLDLSVPVLDVIEHILSIPNDGLQHSITLINLGTNPIHSDPTDWLSILGIETNIQPLKKELVSMPVAITSVTIKDAKTTSNARSRNTQPFSVYWDYGTASLADIIGYHQEIITRLDDISGGTVESATLTLVPSLPSGLKSSPNSLIDVQEGGLFTFSKASGYAEAVRVPALRQDLFLADGQTVDTADTDVVAFTQLLLGAVANPLDFGMTDEEGIAVATLRGAKKSFRK